MALRVFLEKTWFGNILTKRRAAFVEVVSVEETERSHISSHRQWKKLVSKLLAHQVLSTLLYAVKELETVRLRGSSPEMATILHQWADGCLVKVKDALDEGRYRLAL